MSNQARSQVEIRIGGRLDGGFNAAFASADKRMQALGKTATDLNKKVGDIGAYRRQQNALKEAAREYTTARAKVAALKKEIEQSGTATRKQAADLARAEKAAARAGGAYSQARTKLADMARELQRAGVNTSRLSSEYRRLQGEVRNTNTQMQRHEQSLLRQQRLVGAMQKSWGFIKGAVAGSVAAGMALAAPARKALSYDEQLTYAADTAAAGKSAEEKEKTSKELSDAAERARRYSGGASREDVMTALQTLIASGKFDDADVMNNILPSVSRTAFASGAGAEDMAKLAIALRQFGIKDIGAEFDKLMRGGQMGNFELKDMARFFPQQLALAKAAGYSGSGAITDLVAYNQMAMRTAGSQDEAGNNFVNLLAKFTSREMSDSMGKTVRVRRGDPRTKDGKFDWSTYVMQQKEQGVDAIGAFGAILDRQLSSDRRYQAIQKKLKEAKTDEERHSALTSMTDIVEGSALGQIIADRQALMMAMAIRQGQGDLAPLRAGISASSGAVNESAKFVGSQTWAKARLAQGSVDRANEQAFDQISGPLAKVLGGLNDMAEAYPKLTAAAYGAATALAAIAAGAAGWGAMDLLSKGKGAAAGAGAGGAAAGAGALLKKVGWRAGLSRLGLYGATAYGGLKVAEWAGLPDVDEAKGREALAKGDWMGASLRLPATEFLGAAWDRMFSDKKEGGGDEVAKSAADAAKAAAEAAKAAQNRPNVTVQTTNTVTIQTQAADAKTLAPELQAELDRLNRKRDADLRGSYFSNPGYE